MCSRAALAVLALVVARLGMPAPAGAASIFENIGTTPEFHVDPSVRSQAMGGASGAVFWGTGPNYWANPALLGLTEGIAYEDAVTGLAPFIAHRWTLGYGGVGFASAGRPFEALGSLEIDYDALASLTIENEIHSWGIGLSLSSLAASVAGFRHRDPPAFARYADLAFGYNRKSLARDFIPGTEMEGVGVDWGLMARGALPFWLGPGEVPARVEAAYAYSVQNANNVSASGTLGPADRPHRHGVAARFALDLPASWRDRMPAWLAPGFEPLVSLGGAWDREFISVGSGPLVWDESHLGGELGLGNLAFVRLGQVDDRHVWGWGLALPIGRLGGYRYDETRYREDQGFPATMSHAWSVWVNPIEIARTLR